MERDFAVEVGVRLHNSAVNELLQLDIVEVGADHHLEDLEQFAIGNEAVVVDVVDLECKAQLLFLTGAGRQRVQALHELKERNVAVVVAIEHRDDSFHQRVVRKF